MHFFFFFSLKMLLYIFSAITLTIITELDLLPQIHHMGFYCGDPKLSHKYNGDTVTARYLLLLSFLIPLLILIDQNLYQSSFSTYIAMFATFVIGYCLCISSVNFFKILFGEPRPHFFDTCKAPEALNCTPGSYVSEFSCSNSDLRRARDSIKSFPSGHSALSTFSASFVMVSFILFIMTS